MKKNMRNIVRAIAIAMMITVFLTGAALAAEKTIGTIEKTAEFRAEALAEKAIASRNNTVEEVVEGTTEATVEVEEIAEEIEAEEIVLATETVETVVESTPVVEEVVENEVEEIEVEEIEAATVEVETVEEFVEDFEMEMEAEIASTADAATANTEIKTIDGVTTAASADGIVIDLTGTETNTVTATVATTKTATATTKSTVNASNTKAKYLGTTTGTKKAITLVGDSTFRNIDKLQAAIDANNIVCYPNNDMTKGVKYFAGHNPGIMSHIAGLKVGSVVRLSNDNGYQDYRIMEIKTGTGSFASVTFKTSNGTMDAWTMLTRGTENAVIVQYCVNGVNTLHYGVAI